jgi:hypothetical protein
MDRVVKFTLPREVPASLHGGIAAHDARDGDINTMATALNSARAYAEKALTAAQAIINDETKPLPVRHLESKRLTGQLIDRGMQAINAASERVAETLRRLESHTALPQPRDPREQIVCAEICATLRGMKPHERQPFIIGEMRKGRDLVLAAVASCGTPMVAGLDDLQLEHVQLRWRESRFPKEAERMRALREWLDHGQRGRELLASFDGTLYGAHIAKEGAKSEQAIQEAIAIARAAV